MQTDLCFYTEETATMMLYALSADVGWLGTARTRPGQPVPYLAWMRFSESLSKCITKSESKQSCCLCVTEDQPRKQWQQHF